MSADKVPAALGSKVGRARRTLGQLWQAPTFCAGVLAVTIVVATAPWRQAPEAWQREQTITGLRHGLEAEQDSDFLVGLAEKALTQFPEPDARSAEVHFLAGSAYLVQAQQRPEAQARELWPRAAEHLEKALTLGIGDADLPALQFRLGFALVRQNHDLPRAIELMAQAAERLPSPPRAGLQALLQAYLRLPEPDLDGALAASQRLLELSNDRDGDALARARLQHSDLLLRKGLPAEAVKELERVGSKVSAPLLLQARLLRARISEEEGRWLPAAAIWKEILAAGKDLPGGAAAGYLALGRCYRQAEPPDHTAAAEAWQEALKLGGPDGQAAGLRLGELRLAARPPGLTQALEDWRQALEPVKSSADFKNPHVSLEQVRGLFDTALRLATEGEAPVQAQALALLYRKVAPPGVAEEKLAEATEAQARLLAGRTGVKAEAVQAEYRRAGQSFEQAAAAAAAANRAEALWHAVRCYLAAQEPARAAAVLEQYVRLDRNEKRLAEGWFDLGEAFRLQEKKDEARQAYYKCIEYPNTPHACRARFYLAVELLSQEKATAKDLGQARDILEQNLKGPLQDREAHEKSLYQLAWVLLQLQEFDRACIYLKEASRRYPNNPHALFSREQLGQCYRRMADQVHEKEMAVELRRKADVSDQNRLDLEEVLAHHRKTRRGWLEKSVQTYQELTDELEARARARPDVPDLERTLLRRALLSIAENRFELGEYDEALRQYRVLVERSRGKVEGLIACDRIWRLAEVMKQTQEQVARVRSAALEVVRIAEEDLARMKDDSADFKGDNVWTRATWLAHVARVRAQLQAP